MTKLEIAQRIANNHNRLSNIFASGGVTLINSDSVILMGDTIKDMRALVQQIQMDIEEEESAQAKEAQSAEEDASAE